MLPDNLFGALVLSIINMSVCFVVLGFLALVIRLTARAVQAASVSTGRRDSGTAEAEDAVPSEVPSEGSAPAERTSDLTPEEKAAVVAALAVVMTGSGRRIRPFVRGIRDSGAWGRLGKPQERSGIKVRARVR